MRKYFTKDIQNIVVKVGTSILTDKGRFNKKVVHDFASQISQFLKKGIQVSLVSSGAIGAGMAILKMKKRPKALKELQAAAAVGQRYLMECYEEAFARFGFSTAQVLLSWDDLAVRKRFLNAKHTLSQIQSWGLVPIVNENDTVATDEIRFGDNDKLSSLLAILAEADVLVILSDTDGLRTAPSKGKKGKRIQIVEKLSKSILSHVQDVKSHYTVGGMKSKLEAIKICVSSGIPVFLANGKEKKVLSKIFNGEDVGTLFVPNLKRGHRKKSWLSHFITHIRSHKA